MAKLEIELSPDEQARLQGQAERAGLSFGDWARRRLLGLVEQDPGQPQAKPEFDADYAEDRPISLLAERRRQFLAANQGRYEDTDVPADR